ncbi:MAG: CpXC domain-containing protein [Bradymonadaceae bacterium]
MNEVNRAEPFRGSAGQTRRRTVQVRDGTGGTVPAELYDVVNATQDPELGRRLLDGDLNEIQLEGKDERIEPRISVYYHDEERRLFALFVPEELRHREFELRRQLLGELSDAEVRVPEYVRDYRVAVGRTELRRLHSGELEAVEPGGQPDAGAPDPDQQRAELDRRRDRLEDERRELEEQRAELEELRDELDEWRRELDEERDELERRREELRQSSPAEAEQTAPEPSGSVEPERDRSDEVTQVVEDEQFVEVAEESAYESTHSEPAGGTAAPADEPSEAVVLDEGSRKDESGGDVGEQELPENESTRVAERPSDLARAEHTVVRSARPPFVTEDFDELPVDSLSVDDMALGAVEGGVLAAVRLEDDDRVDPLLKGGLDFFVQYQTESDYPVIGLLLATLDDEGMPIESIGWPIDPAGHGHDEILDRLVEEMVVHTALYDSDGTLLEAYRIRGPFEENLDWILDRVEADVERDDLGAGDFDDAARSYASHDSGVIGETRYNFDRPEFRQLDTPAQVQLAASVVGNWSSGDEFEYLVTDRSYPLSRFRDLQRAVATAAVETGIHLNEPLRDVAVEQGLAEDETALVEQIAANFAEVAVELRDNDLSPADEWDNWSSLIEVARDVGADLDPDVLELAEASLEKLRDHREMPDEGGGADSAAPSDGAAAPGDEETTEGTDVDADQGDEDESPDDAVDTMVVGKRSEATGVTYYLPEAEVIDSFDDLADVPRDDLIKLLDDPNGRLEAAQMLIERFDASVVPDVMETAEKMTAAEVAALARFLETKAEGLEAELVRSVESAGPNGTFAATRALAQVRSTSALPTLVRTYRDDSRDFDVEKMARALAGYEDKILPTLRQSIQREGVDERVVRLIRELDERDESLVERLENDRSEEVQRAASRALD